MLKFKEWIIQEATTAQIAQAAKFYGLNPGDAVNIEALKKQYRKWAMQYHPDRNPGDKEAENKFKQAATFYEILKNLTQIPNIQTPRPNWQGHNWQPRNPIEELKKDIRDELMNGIQAIKIGQPEDAFAAVSRLVDPNVGKLKNLSNLNPILLSSLNGWLQQYNNRNQWAGNEQQRNLNLAKVLQLALNLV